MWLAYEEEGIGTPPIVLVHGWCCDNTYFVPQTEHFRLHHRVIAVDLRGHGQSDKPEQVYSVGSFADDLAWLCEQLVVKDPIIIGHSMGGAIAAEFAARYPDVPAAIVAIDSPLIPSRERVDRVNSLVASLRGPDYGESARHFISGMFLSTDDPRRKTQIVDSMSSAPQHVMISALEELYSWDGSVALGACQCPVLFISSGRVVEDLSLYRTLCPQSVWGQTVGAGHFNQLEVPDQVNNMIERFITTSMAPQLDEPQ